MFAAWPDSPLNCAIASGNTTVSARGNSRDRETAMREGRLILRILSWRYVLAPRCAIQARLLADLKRKDKTPIQDWRQRFFLRLRAPLQGGSERLRDLVPVQPRVSGVVQP